MIFVTLGTQDKSFKRLLEAIDKAIDEGKIKTKVVVQAGCTEYESKNMEIFDLVPMDQFEELINKCDLLITHGGVGSIITGLKHHKKVIAAARLKEYHEHVNDHQLQIIEELAADGYLLALDNFSDLSNIITKSKNFEPKPFLTVNKKMLALVESTIDKYLN